MNIRKAKSSDVRNITNVHIESWKSTYKGIFSEDFLDNIDFNKRYKLWERVLHSSSSKEIVYVAELNNEIVGFISGGPSRTDALDSDAEIYALYLLEDYQRQGIGRKLLENAFQEMREYGYETAFVWVLKDNPAVNFYKKTGGEVIKEEVVEIEGEKYKEMALEWKDISGKNH